MLRVLPVETRLQTEWCLLPNLDGEQVMLPMMQFCTSTPLQQAFADILEEAEQPFQDHSRCWLLLGRLRRRVLILWVSCLGVVFLFARAATTYGFGLNSSANVMCCKLVSKELQSNH